MDRIFKLIVAERKAQDARWGPQTGNADTVWMTILTEEVGEVAKAVLEREWELQDELIQVAAVAVAWLEALENRS